MWPRHGGRGGSERFDLGGFPLPEMQHGSLCSWSPWRFSQDLFHVADMAPGGCPLGFPGHRGRASLGLDRPPPSKAVIRDSTGFLLGLSRGAAPASALVAWKLQRMHPSSFYGSVVSIHTCSPQRKSGDIETASQVSRTSGSYGQHVHIDPGRARVAHFLCGHLSGPSRRGRGILGRCRPLGVLQL